eukprot:Sdes_comp23495_c0_seq1m21726
MEKRNIYDNISLPPPPYRPAASNFPANDTDTEYDYPICHSVLNAPISNNFAHFDLPVNVFCPEEDKKTSDGFQGENYLYGTKFPTKPVRSKKKIFLLLLFVALVVASGIGLGLFFGLKSWESSKNPSPLLSSSSVTHSFPLSKSSSTLFTSSKPSSTSSFSSLLASTSSDPTPSSSFSSFSSSSSSSPLISSTPISSFTHSSASTHHTSTATASATPSPNPK